MPPNRPRRDRYLSMLEMASLLKLEGTPRERRRRVRRLIQRLERRDGTSYTKRFGEGSGKLFVSIGALEQLMPWSPGTLTAVREDIDGIGVKVRRLSRRVDGHDREIEHLQEVQRRSAELLAFISSGVGPKGTKKGPLPTGIGDSPRASARGPTDHG